MNTPKLLRGSQVAGAVLMALAAARLASAAPLAISETPLFVAAGNKPNVLLTIANSNSMDEDPSGLAIGSAAPNSRSEIARRVARGLVANYGGAVNMGLMAFQQHVVGGDAVRAAFLHTSPYDISFDPANYDPTYSGPRDAPTKRFREPNPSWPGNFIYYNVNLPFYTTGGNAGTGFCYSSTADAFNNGENPVGNVGPWDNYVCFSRKQSASDVLPTPLSEAALGWNTGRFGSSFFPTDSDLGQGITDFGRFLSWQFTSNTWFSNGSPGGGYLHVPVGAVNAARATAMNTKLGTSQFGNNQPVTATFPLQNAGLTPLEGTMYTIRDYFQGNLIDAARGGPQPAPPNSCGRDYSVILTNGLPSVTRFGVPSSDVATLLADATAASAAVHAADIDNYIVGFALPFGVNPAQLDTIAAAGGTIASYYAENEAQLTLRLNEVFNNILVRSGAAGAVAVNSGFLQTDSRLYQGKFNTGDWSGQLLSFPVSGENAVLGLANWDAGARLNALNWNTDRNIITYNSDEDEGVPFRWPADPTNPDDDELTPAQVTMLNTSPLGVADARGNLRLQFLRGSAANEGNGPADFRIRNVSKLGDIVNSAPLFVGPPNRNITDPTYTAFKAAWASRKSVIYVGANDGMLHAFDAEDGDELLGYVPTPVYPRLSGLTAQGFQHKFLVDGPQTAADIKFSSGWRTMLVGGLGAGGRGIYALDITNPSDFTEGKADDVALWEFTAADDNDLGLTYGAATIIKLNGNTPGVIVGNGYNNTGSGRAKLFILNAETGSVIREIDTGIGTVGDPNGLSTPTVIDHDGNGTADYAYAGDLKGNLWKFDLSSTNSGSWSVAYGGVFFPARDASNNPQAITTAPEVTRHPQGGYMVLFGTGLYVQASDVATTGAQTMYGVRDNGAAVAGRALLQEQQVVEVVTEGGKKYRDVSQNVVNWGLLKGWYLDLPDSGERVIVDPLLRFGKFVVTTSIPNADPCAAGGSSWLMVVDYLGGGRVSTLTFDVNNDGKVTDADKLTFAAGDHGGSGVAIDHMASTPTIINTGVDHLKSNTHSGDIIDNPLHYPPLANRRTSWRQIQ